MYPTASNRRQFLGLVSASCASLIGLSEPLKSSEGVEETPLVDSLPSLQCPTETGIAVCWAVNALSLGKVEFGTDPNKLDKTAYGEMTGMKAYHDRFFQIRLENLEPERRYYYRTATTPLTYIAGHIQHPGETVYSEVFSFETPGLGRANASFAVINDTHNRRETLELVAAKLSKIDADYTIWNGDILGSYDNSEVSVQAILKPGGGQSFSVKRPLLYVPGNHEYYGTWARNLPYLFAPWEHSDFRDRRFTRNFVVRNGPIALIGLDTGDNRADNNPDKGGTILFDSYREAQCNWLERALQSQVVTTASFVVAFCHIPLFDPNPNANGGDLPIAHGRFQRQAGKLWGSLLDRYGVQLVIAAHTHFYRCDAPTSERQWMQLVGGGPDLNRHPITVIHGTANKDSLEVVIHELVSGTELHRFSFPKRT